MDDPFGVRGVERIGKLNTPFQQAIDRYRARAQAPVKRLPLQQLHCNKGLLTSLFHRINSADVGMV